MQPVREVFARGMAELSWLSCKRAALGRLSSNSIIRLISDTRAVAGPRFFNAAAGDQGSLKLRMAPPLATPI